jgi:ribosomal-protein-alanine N-acetyltransferase
MVNLTIRTCEFRDLDRVVALEKASFPDRPYRKSDFLLLLTSAKNGFQLGLMGDSLAGYVIAMERNGGEGMIFSMAVAPEFRRRGFGEALLVSAVNHLAVRYRRAYLLVDEKNEGAIRLYHKVLFKETGNIVERYYPNGDNAVEMVRELGEDQYSTANESG